jgi:hypothetical protein
MACEFAWPSAHYSAAAACTGLVALPDSFAYVHRATIAALRISAANRFGWRTANSTAERAPAEMPTTMALSTFSSVRSAACASA